MSNSLCRGGLPCPPAITTCLSGFQLARVVGASRSCRSRRYTLSSLLSVATLSSPGPRAQHPTSHRVSQLVDGCDFGCVDKFRVGEGRCACPPMPFSSSVTASRRGRLHLQSHFRYLNCHWTTAEWAMLTNPPRRGGPPCPPVLSDEPQSLHRQRIHQQCTPGCPAAKVNELCTGRDVHDTSA